VEDGERKKREMMCSQQSVRLFSKIV
jgi:hypothetical protein